MGNVRGDLGKENPLLSQEGWREAPGWFRSDHLSRWRFGNHPSRDPLRDPAALLTQEGNFRQQDRILVMDGAMGTFIASAQKDSLNLTSPELIQSIHRQYLDAGADILKTNTFNSNRGPEDYAINLAGARLARAVADEYAAANPLQPRYVAGAMGPGQDGAASIDGFFLQASGLVEGGVDMLLAETITSTRTAQSVMAAIEKLFMKIGRELPVLLSVTIGRRGGLISGESMEAFWDTVCSCGLFAVGINCGFGAKHSRPFLEQLSKMANTRISFHPSAGLPNATGGYDETPEEFAAIMGELAKRGQVNIIGGCCGSTPAHTRAIAAAVRGIPRVTIDPL
jgi:5-methyltetrahydrofolate--homocysteine methyltransferase